jgi:hypothetical protein
MTHADFSVFIISSILLGSPDIAAEFKRVVAEGHVDQTSDWMHKYIASRADWTHPKENVK